MSKPSITVKDFMTLAPHAIEPHQSVASAHQRMRQLNVLHMPVRAAGKAVGILAERDIEVLSSASKGTELNTLEVGEVMTPDPFCVRPDEPLSNVAASMAKAKIGSALVVDANGTLVGIFTVTDALRALSSLV